VETITLPVSFASWMLLTEPLGISATHNDPDAHET